MCHIKRSEDSMNLLPFITNLAKECEVDLIVLDGDLSSLIRAVYLILGKYLKTKMITCTPHRGLDSISQEVWSQCAKLGFFTMESWSKKEYEGAILAGALSIQISELDERNYYAGGSTLFFELPIKLVITIYREKLYRLDDMSKFVGKRGIGFESEDASNDLMAIHNKSNTIVSKYVFRKLLYEITDDWIAKARLNLNSTVWQGWVTENEVLRLAMLKKLFFYAPHKEPESWLSEEALIGFENAESPVLGDVDHVGWFYPKIWNHECFDALFRVSKDTIRVVQIADASTHSCHLEHLIPYVVAMKVQSIDFVFICRRKNFEFFKIPKIREIQEQYNSLMEAVKANEKIDPSVKKRKHVTTADYLNFRKVCYQP